MDYLFYITLLIVFVLIMHHKGEIYPARNIKKISPNFTIIEIFRKTSEKYPNHSALKIKRNNKWKTVSYKKYYEQCKIFSNSIKSLKVRKKSYICIMGNNSPEWFYSHLGTMMGGNVPVGIYPTAETKTCEYIVDHCKPKVLIVDNLEYLDKFEKILNPEDSDDEHDESDDEIEKQPYGYENDIYLNNMNFTDERNFELLNPVPKEEKIKKKIPKKEVSVKYIIVYSNIKLDTNQYNKNIKIYTWKQFMNIGSQSVHKSTISSGKSTATLIYTSGTTGNPKGVVISHRNISNMINMLINKFRNNQSRQLILEEKKERIVSYLPLNHIAAQMLDIYLPICIAGTVWFADSMALKGTLVNTLREARPTIFAGVPRVWEKIYENIENKLQKISNNKKLLMDISNSFASIGNDNIIKKLGLNQCKFRITMAAPLSNEIKNYFIDLGMPIYEIYGMSETCGPLTIALPGDNKYGSVGKPLPGIQVNIKKDKEILVKGPSIFSRYYHDPDSTNKAIIKKRWFCTGDLGYLDDDGYLYITGRKKELIITAGGENIAPIVIENNIKQCIPIVSHAVVIGDKRKYLTALLVLKMQPRKDGEPTILFTKETNQIIKSLGSKAKNVIDAEDDPKIKKYIEEGIKCANKMATSNVHKIKKWKLIPNSFTVKGGELTPTMKLKRSFVSKKYSDLIEEMYFDK